MQPKNLIWLVVIFMAVALGCSGGGDSSGDDDDDGAGDDDSGDDDTDDDDSDDDVEVEGFPVGLAVASPLAVVGESGTKADWTSAYDWMIEQIEAILSGETPPSEAFDAALFLSLPGRAMCYGPTLDYEDHPDGSLPNSGQLPSGDLGMWLEVDEVSLGGTGDACAAAQLNAQMEGMQNQSYAALSALASMVSVADAAGLVLPTVGGTLTMTTEMNAAGIADVTFSLAEIEQPSAGLYTYSLEFAYDTGSFVHDVTVSLIHESAGTGTEYDGTLYYTVVGDDTHFPGGNCPQSGRTLNGSLVYVRDGETDLKTQSRLAFFCGADAGAVDASGQVDPEANLAPPSTEGWSENFSVFVSNFNPDDLSGEYVYLWQAGSQDSHTRMFNIGINANSPLDGEAFYGYGEQAWDTDGTVSGFICNWAGPGSTNTVHDYAQRQFVEFDGATGLFTQPTGGSDILYAPTNSCTYDGSGSFWYDRNLNGSADETATDLDVNTPDLMAPDSGQTVAEKIADRGFDIPEAPGGWPADSK